MLGVQKLSVLGFLEILDNTNVIQKSRWPWGYITESSHGVYLGNPLEELQCHHLDLSVSFPLTSLMLIVVAATVNLKKAWADFKPSSLMDLAPSRQKARQQTYYSILYHLHFKETVHGCVVRGWIKALIGMSGLPECLCQASQGPHFCYRYLLLGHIQCFCLSVHLLTREACMSARVGFRVRSLRHIEMDIQHIYSPCIHSMEIHTYRLLTHYTCRTLTYIAWTQNTYRTFIHIHIQYV